jgi:hypothetical protein
MIGKAEWFGRRKYTGWGLTPVTWQGWVYLAVAFAPIILLQYLPLSGSVRLTGMVVWGILLAYDFLDRMVHIKKDEREVIHEAIAERNAAWTMILVLTVGVAYDAARNAVLNQTFNVNPFILAALIGGVLIKAATNLYLERKA